MRATLGRFGSTDATKATADPETVKKYEVRMGELEGSVDKLKGELQQSVTKNADLQKKFASLEEEYEALLDEMIAKEEERSAGGDNPIDSISELKNKLESQFNTKREEYIRQLEELRLDLAKKENEIERQNSQLMDQKWQIEHLQTTNSSLQPGKGGEGGAGFYRARGSTAEEKEKELEELRLMMSRQLEEFNKMKDNLMKDLQNRCLKVIELEISLDQSRDQYQSLLRTKTPNTQQKKMITLEKNLQGVNALHKQLLEQNSTLKRDNALMTQKMEGRANRIHELEVMLQDAQERANRDSLKAETEVRVLQDKLATVQKQKDVSSNLSGLAGSNIAKPIRGGGAAAPSSPVP